MKAQIVKLNKHLWLGLLTSLVGGALMLTPNLNVYAASNPQAPTPVATAVPDQGNSISQAELAPARLERLYKREQTALDSQGKRLAAASSLTDRVQNFLGKLAAKGINVEALQSALTDFKAALPGVTNIHANAQSILSTHAGFDANGAVTDVTMARRTVASAGEALNEAHQLIKTAFTDMLSVFKQYRQQHPKLKLGTAPTAPVPTPAAG